MLVAAEHTAWARPNGTSTTAQLRAPDSVAQQDTASAVAGYAFLSSSLGGCDCQDADGVPA